MITLQACLHFNSILILTEDFNSSPATPTPPRHKSLKANNYQKKLLHDTLWLR